MGEWKDLDVSGFDINLNDRLTILEEQYELVEYYYTVTSGTTGTVSIPTGYTIEMDRFTNGIDAIVAKEGTDSRPTDEAVYTSLGVIISTTLAANGNYVFSGIPSGYNVCIVYYLKGQRKYRSNLVYNNLANPDEFIPINPITGSGTTNKVPKFTASKTLGNSNIEDTGTIVKIPVVTNIGDGGTTNYSQFESTGFVKHVGSSKYWVDIDFPIIVRTTGTGIPTLTAFNGNLTMPLWAVNDFNMCESQEFIHAWEEGSTCYWHLHLNTNGVDITNRYVRFELEYGYTDGNGLWTFPAVVTTSDILIPANTPSKTQIIMSLANFTPTGSKIGGHAIARLKRVASVGTAPTNNPWIPMLQLHILCDTGGSRNMTSK